MGFKRDRHYKQDDERRRWSTDRVIRLLRQRFRKQPVLVHSGDNRGWVHSSGRWWFGRYERDSQSAIDNFLLGVCAVKPINCDLYTQLWERANHYRTSEL